MSSAEKLRFILDEVKKGNVLVLERGLTAEEEIDLIKKTMSEIDHESFIGIETPTFPIDFRKRSLIDRIFRRSQSPRMMVVGPAHLLKTIKKDGMMIQTRVLTGGSVVAEFTEGGDVSDEEGYTDSDEEGYEKSSEIGEDLEGSDEYSDDLVSSTDSEVDKDTMYHAPAEEDGQEVTNQSALGDDSSESKAPLTEPIENSELEVQDIITDDAQPVLDPFQVQPFEIPEAPETSTDINTDTDSKTEDSGNDETSEEDSEENNSNSNKRLKQEEE
jgi:hypothetical protein